MGTKPCPHNLPIPDQEQYNNGFELEISSTGPTLITGTFPSRLAVSPSWASRQAPSNGPYNIVIVNTWFEDPISGHPIWLISGDPGQDGMTDTGQIHDVLFRNNTISGGGIQIGTALRNIAYSDHTQCDGNPIYADDPSLSIPRNIFIEQNTFYSNQGAVSGFGRYVKIFNNSITSYYWPEDADGGMLEQESCSDQVQIVGNTIDGGGWVSDSSHSHPITNSGLELYGRNTLVTGNWISGLTNEGIGLHSTYKADVHGNQLWGNILCRDWRLAWGCKGFYLIPEIPEREAMICFDLFC